MATSAELAVQFGFEEAFFRSDPELWSIFQKAKNGNWTPTRFQAAFMNTNWYKQREASVRQWADLTTRDPAEARNKVEERIASLRDQVSQLGLSIDDATLNNLATQSLQFAWTDAQLHDVMGQYVGSLPGSTSGTIAQVEASIKDLAYQFGVDVSDSQMQSWITGVVDQSINEAGLQDYVRDMARSKYAGMAGYLDTGMTTRQIAAPYLQTFGKLMEVDPDSVSLDDPLMANALQGVMDPKTGTNTMQTVASMQKSIKQDQRWLRTSNAKQDMTDAGMRILQDMGLYS